MTAPTAPPAPPLSGRAAHRRAAPAAERHQRDGRQGAPIDPRIRARRAEVLRSEARHRLHLALVVLAVVALLVGGWLALHSRLFAARVVTVVGAVHTPVAEIVAAAGLSDHPPLVDVGAAAVAGVERLPWISQATVSREWPDGVRITVVERTPVATAEERSGPDPWALVDRTGRVLALQAQPQAGLPRVRGPGTPGRPGSTAVGLRAALRVVTSLPAAFAGQVDRVDEDHDGDVTLSLTSALTVYLGSTDQLAQKYEDVAAILAAADLTSGSTIDVAAPATPVVQP